MKALQIDKKMGRLGAARFLSSFSPSAAAKFGPLDLVTIDPPVLPGPGWHHVHTHLAGICGSDLSTVEGHASPYFDDWVSFPFVPGHEVVGHLGSGQRVVIEPVLGHAARGFEPPFPGAAPGDGNDYAHLVTGHLEPGIQIGFCNSTCGGWAPQFIAHDSQLHDVPDAMSDEQAVLVEPAAGGIHAALLTWPILAANAGSSDRPVVAVLGAGTMGLCAIAGLRRYIPNVQIIVGARYAHQQSLATAFGADIVVKPDELARAVRRVTGSHMVGDHLSGGADATIDAVGTSDSIGQCLRFTRPRGRVVLMGMPAEVTVDLTGLWHRETQLVGAYTYGTETMPDGSRKRTFDLAIETAAALNFQRLLSATYRIDDHQDAIAHAATAGRRGAVKIAFDLRPAVRTADGPGPGPETLKASE
ncbi:MAG: putative oxidoreductase [Ilumatobacteraceae bacterium]|nr:putative oxidoreductase [Ilumatobacteraceae bacterium]